MPEDYLNSITAQIKQSDKGVDIDRLRDELEGWPESETAPETENTETQPGSGSGADAGTDSGSGT